VTLERLRAGPYSQEAPKSSSRDIGRMWEGIYPILEGFGQPDGRIPYYRPLNLAFPGPSSKKDRIPSF
jgi:hypothetical protein